MFSSPKIIDQKMRWNIKKDTEWICEHSKNLDRNSVVWSSFVEFYRASFVVVFFNEGQIIVWIWLWVLTVKTLSEVWAVTVVSEESNLCCTAADSLSVLTQGWGLGFKIRLREGYEYSNGLKKTYGQCYLNVAGVESTETESFFLLFLPDGHS